jgi:acylphosphatase
MASPKIRPTRWENTDVPTHSKIKGRIWLAAMAVMLAACSGCRDSSGKSPTSASQPAGAAAPASTPTASTSTPASVAARQSAAGQQRRVHVFISGGVQGVGFRAFTLEQARGLKLMGFVRNLADGRVELVAQGPADDVNKLIEQVKHGPSSARVDKFDCKDETPNSEFQRFEVR